MATDAMCGAGIAAHVSHLMRLIINVPTEVKMRRNLFGVWELVAQRVHGGERTCAGNTEPIIVESLAKCATGGFESPARAI